MTALGIHIVWADVRRSYGTLAASTLLPVLVVFTAMTRS